ncbi:MAG TPA: zf-HC2 domain-containing protein [Vicinamibacterales bacterium]|nr:zf-HC2 domain-containing protein [Vicinamibacterales bacterium]
MMTNPFTCDDKATLIAYMYGEVDAAIRDRVEAHLARCAACAAEVTALGDVRAELGLWVPPDVELGFTIVRKSDHPAATVLRPAQWWRTVPAWAQAAAAVLVMAAGLGIANVQVRSGPDGLAVSTGWMTPATAPVAAPANDTEWKTALVSLEQQLRTEIRSARDQQPTATRVSAPAVSDDAVLRRVQQLLAASEERQARELATRLTQLNADMNLQRRADLMRIQQSFAQYGDQMMQQRQMLNNVIRVSAGGQQ